MSFTAGFLTDVEEKQFKKLIKFRAIYEINLLRDVFTRFRAHQKDVT